jgi:hypothetical protein
MSSSVGTLAETMVAVWRQALVENRAEVELATQKCPVTRTRSKGLRAVSFVHRDHQIEGIEQNPETQSRWAALARGGSQIMQFRWRGRYIGNVCDGALMRYPS